MVCNTGLPVEKPSAPMKSSFIMGSLAWVRINPLSCCRILLVMAHNPYYAGSGIPIVNDPSEKVFPEVTTWLAVREPVASKRELPVSTIE